MSELLSSDLLTAEEYRRIASELQLPTQAFINGEFTASQSGRTFTTTNPATGEALAEIAACDSTMLTGRLPVRKLPMKLRNGQACHLPSVRMFCLSWYS